MATLDQSQLSTDPSSRTSPQGDILDYLIWDRLSAFWKTAYRTEDRQALNAIYEAIGNVLDAEMVRLTEINMAKGIFTCPVFAQRRWVRLDLNRYKEMKAFLEYAVGGKAPGTVNGYQTCAQSSSSSTGDDARYLSCTALNGSHAAHWHISFSWTLSGATVLDRRTVNLRYPLQGALIDVWKMAVDGLGRLTGTKLVFGIDYTILPDGTSLRLNAGEVGDRYDVVVALNLSDRTVYDGRLPSVRLAVGPFPGLRTVAIPPEFDGFPIHLQIVRNPAPVVGFALQDSNNTALSSIETFVPDADMPAPGLAAFPSTIAALTSDDVVFVFGSERVADGAPFTRLHTHERFTFYVSTGTAPLPSGAIPYIALGTTVSEIPFPNGTVLPGINQSTGYLGQELNVSIDGRKLHYSEFLVSPGSNSLTLRVPIVLTSDYAVRVDVAFTREFEGLESQTLELHNHFSCYRQNPTPLVEFQQFDDGGDFDVDSEEVNFPPWGTFDATVTTSILYLAVTDVDIETLKVYVNGILLSAGIDYRVAVEPATADSTGRTRIVIAQNITGTIIEATYRRAGTIVTYSMVDIFGGSASCTAYLTPDTVDAILGNVGYLLTNFTDQYGPISNPAALVEAIRVLAAGGNPMLTLFADEFSDYLSYQIDAAGQPYTATDARNIESLNTKLVAIPALVDHPHRPTVRLFQTQDYTIVDGGIGSARDLTAPRGPDDANPGVWWCPVIMLDEHTLARTFGNMVGDVRDSSPGYRDALVGNHIARFAGPSTTAIESAAAIILGSQVFQQDGKVIEVSSITTARDVTIHGTGLDKVYRMDTSRRAPPVGALVFAGQSIASPVAFISTLSTFKSWNGSTLVLAGIFQVAQSGDLVWLELTRRGTDNTSWVRLTVDMVSLRTVQSNPGAVETVIVFKEKVAVNGMTLGMSSRIKVSRPAPAPFADFDGVVDSVHDVIQWRIRTSGNETFLLPVDTPLDYHVGTVVRRGDAVVHSFATMYDDIVRPNWQWLDPANDTSYQHLFTAGVVPTSAFDDARFATVDPGVNGYSRVMLSRIDPLPPRGTKMSLLVDNSGDTEIYTVVGTDGVVLTVTPAVTLRRSGIATFTVPKTGIRATYFEVPNTTGLSSTLSAPHSVNATALQLVSTSGFPDAGRVTLALPGGAIEVEYYCKAGNFLSDLVWIDLKDHGALIDNEGRTGSVVPTCTVSLMSTYTNRIMNPAAEALIRQRVVRDQGTSTGEPRLDEAAVDEYYRLFRQNAAVLELSRVGTPTSLRLMLEDVVPPSTSLIVLSTHVIADAYDGGARDG